MATEDMPGAMLNTFTCVLSFYPPNNPVSSWNIMHFWDLLFPFYRLKSWG